jgi:hypothetical protein
MYIASGINLSFMIKYENLIYVICETSFISVFICLRNRWLFYMIYLFTIYSTSANVEHFCAIYNIHFNFSKSAVSNCTY